MKIPEYWARATAEEITSDGHKVASTCWRWSDDSRADAEQVALTTAKRLLARLLQGVSLERYDYGRGPLREEVLNRLFDADQQPLVAVTRNRAGAIILNTARAAFLDLDFPPTPIGQQLGSLLGWLWGKRPEPPEARQELEILNRLEQYVAEHPSHGFRVYRTCAGVRALATSGLFEPTAPATIHMFEHLKADPLYIRLCQGQECFRARLTPKPWRCGCSPNRVAWPRDQDVDQQRFGRWEAKYAARQGGFATCRFLKTLGNPRVHADLNPIIQLHDQMTRCHEDLPLA
jgi:hypothetical protein